MASAVATVHVRRVEVAFARLTDARGRNAQGSPSAPVDRLAMRKANTAPKATFTAA